MSQAWATTLLPTQTPGVVPLGHHRRARKKKTVILSFHRSQGPRIGRFKDRRKNRGYPRLEKEGKEGYCLLDSEFLWGWCALMLHMGFPGGSGGKEYACNVGDTDSISGSGRSPGEGNGNPLQYSCLRNSTEEPGGLQSIGSQRVRHNWATNTFTSFHVVYISQLKKKKHTRCCPEQGGHVTINILMSGSLLQHLWGN